MRKQDEVACPPIQRMMSPATIPAMLRNLFNKFQNERPNPTGDWPMHLPQAPAVDLDQGLVGPLRFGDALESARTFGQSSGVQWINPTNFSLIYAEGGFEIAFELGRFVYAAWFIGPDPHVPNVEGLCFARPVANGVPLSSDTTIAEIEAAFGVPTSRDDDKDETILFYRKNHLTVEFECTPGGTLKRLNVFPTAD